MSEGNEKGSNNLSCSQVFFIVIVLAAASWFFFPSEKSGHESSSQETKKYEAPKPPPPYTEQDALKDLSWYEGMLSGYVKMNSMDYSTARKAMSEVNRMYADLNDIKSRSPYSVKVDSAYKKLLSLMPKAQKKIYPKMRRAWVNGRVEEFARMNVRISCRNKSCDQMTFKSIRYANISAIQADKDAYDSEFVKLRVKKIWFDDSFGSGTAVTYTNTGDDRLETN